MMAIGENWVEGVCVTVTRKRVKRMSLRVKADGSVALSLPLRGVALWQGEAFVRAQWTWVERARDAMARQAREAPRAATPEEEAQLAVLLGELHAEWAERLGEKGVAWRLSRMRSRWGVCHFQKRRVGYSTMLAGRGRDEVEYVVVHELTHLAVHDHGPRFQRLMDERLPDWRRRRRLLNRRVSGTEGQSG